MEKEGKEMIVEEEKRERQTHQLKTRPQSDYSQSSVNGHSRKWTALLTAALTLNPI